MSEVSLHTGGWTKEISIAAKNKISKRKWFSFVVNIFESAYKKKLFT
jgi:hypothetical protein